MAKELEQLAKNPAFQLQIQLSRPTQTWCALQAMTFLLEAQPLQWPPLTGSSASLAATAWFQCGASGDLPKAFWGSELFMSRPRYLSLAPEEDGVARLLRQRRYVQAGEVRQAVAGVLQDWRDEPRLATGVLRRLRSRPLTAWQVLEAMRMGRVEANVIHYSNGIIACESQGAWQLALDLLEAMLQQSIQQDVVSMSSVIAACEKAGRWQCALGVLQAMMDLDLAANVVSYSSAISACEKKGQWQQAMHLLGAMLAQRVRPNDVTCNAVMSACQAQGQWQIAVAILDGMVDLRISPDIISYNSVLSTCESLGLWHHALLLLQQMLGAQLKPNIRSCNSIMSTLHEGRRWSQALDLLAFMSSSEISPDVTTCSLVVAACEPRWLWVATILSLLNESSLQPTLLGLLDTVKRRPSRCSPRHLARRSIVQRWPREGTSADGRWCRARLNHTELSWRPERPAAMRSCPTTPHAQGLACFRACSCALTKAE